MGKGFVYGLVSRMCYYLRYEIKESVYKTAKESGLRAETVSLLETPGVALSGSAAAVDVYISSFCARYPKKAGQIFRDQRGLSF